MVRRVPTDRPADTAPSNGRAVQVPQARESERAVLGRLLLDPEALPEAQGLEPQHFHVVEHGLIYAAVLALTERGDVIETATIVDELRRMDALDRVRDPHVAILDLAGETTVAIEHHVGRIRDAWERRLLLEKAHDALGVIAGARSAADARGAVQDLFADGQAPTAGGSAIARAWAPLPPAVMVESPPPRRWLLRHPTRNSKPCAPGAGDGLLPRGVAGLLSADGGSGKTLLALQLAVALTARRPWLEHFAVPMTEGGRVLLALGEEDAAEVHRRLHAIAEALNLEEDEREAVHDGVVVLPLAGKPVALLAADGVSIVETAELRDLRRLLHDQAGADGWAAIVLDPLSRFGGLAEGSNEVATRFVQVLESLTEVPGSPVVLVTAHTSKHSRRQREKDDGAEADARGVTALIDGVRWAASLTVRARSVDFRQVKSNYSPPMAEPLRLVRAPGGVLLAEAEAERDARTAAESHADEQRQRAQAVADAAVVAPILALNPGASLRDLRAAVRATGAKIGNSRLDVAIAVLGPSAVLRPGPRNATLHYLNGEKVPADVLAEVPADARSRVSDSRPPEGSV